MAEPVTTEELENALQEQAHKTAEWVFQNYVKAKSAMSFARMRDEMASDFIQAAREALANRKAKTVLWQARSLKDKDDDDAWFVLDGGEIYRLPDFEYRELVPRPLPLTDAGG